MAKEKSYGVAPYLIINGQYYILLNKTSEHSRYNFFKGKIEEGETIAQCAKREFWEETGVEVDERDFEEYFFQKSSKKDVGIFLINWSKYINKKFQFQKREIWASYWVEVDDVQTSKNQKEIVDSIESFFKNKSE